MGRKPKRSREGDCHVRLIAPKEWRRSGEFNRHHLKPGSRGGQTIGSNLLILDVERHKAWHFIFGNLTLSEIIELLEYIVSQSKKSKRSKCSLQTDKFPVDSKVERDRQKVEKNLVLLDVEHYKAWRFLFHSSTLNEVIEILERVHDAKRRIARKLLAKNLLKKSSFNII